MCLCYNATFITVVAIHGENGNKQHVHFEIYILQPGDVLASDTDYSD
jgi:hypothetical protein